MNIIVTGGAGFIGSHLVDRLVTLGHRVGIVDNFSTGKREFVHPEAELCEMDILNPGLTDAFVRFQPEVVYHLAAQVSVGRSVEAPLFDAQTNIQGSLAVWDAAIAAGVRKIVYASSAAVYGYPMTERIAETHPVRPLSAYGISKHTPEHYAAVYRNLYGIDYTVLRFANVYGGRQDAQGEGGVVSVFATRLMNGAQPIIHGTGEQTRDYIYVLDVVEAAVAALQGGSGKILNVSTNQATTVNELLRIMCEASGKSFEPLHASPRPGDIPHSVLDNGAAKATLGWKPVYSLKQGLAETLRYYESHPLD